MNVKELRQALEEAEGILAAAGAKTPSKGLRAFLAIFEGHDEQQVGQFLADLRERLSNPTPTVQKKGTVLNESAVEGYVQRLRQAGVDKGMFDRVFAGLKKDKSVRKQEAYAIAHRYIGGRDKWPKKADALKAIEAWFAQRAYQAVKMVQVDKGTPWIAANSRT